MAVTITPVDIGSAPDDGTGDPARTAFGKVNTNESNLATAVDAATDQLSGAASITGDLQFDEKADHTNTPAAGKGLLWVRSDTPNKLVFTDDAGTDFDLTSTGDVSKVGTPADNQVGVWTGDGTIEGTAGLTYNGTTFAVTGAITGGSLTIDNITIDAATISSASGGISFDNDNLLTTGSITGGNLACTGTFTSRGIDDNATTEKIQIDDAVITARTAVDLLTNTLTTSGDIIMAEKADHGSTPTAGYGYLWTKSDTPSALIFTDDAGTDWNLTGGSVEGTSVLSTGPVTDGYVLTADGAGGAAWEAATGGLANIVEDTTPQLGGMLDVNGQALGDGTLEILKFGETALAVNEVTITNAATGNAPVISATGDDASVDISILPKGSGNVSLGTMTFDSDMVIGAGQDNYVLTYDNGTGLVSLEAAAGGGAFTADGNGLISATSAPVLDEATGDEVAYTFNYTTNKATSGNDTGLLINQTDTLSPGTSLLADFQVGGTSKFQVNNSGVALIASGGSVQFGSSTHQIASSSDIQLRSSGRGLIWASHLELYTGGFTTKLYSDANNALALRNSTNAQTYNVYNTYTDASNYERGFLKWNSNVLEIGTVAAGTGTGRELSLITSGNTIRLGEASTNDILFNFAASVVTVSFYQSGNFLQENDKSGAGAMWNFGSSGNRELIATNASQQTFTIAPRVNQSGTAAFDGLLVNTAEEDGFGDGSTGDGNNLLRLASLGTTKYKVSTTGLISVAVATGITAFAGGGQASATALTTSYNVVDTVATTGDSVKLPTAAAGQLVTIINNGANACDVFPNTSDNLGAGVDTASSLAAGSNITYLAIDATNWEVI